MKPHADNLASMHKSLRQALAEMRSELLRSDGVGPGLSVTLPRRHRPNLDPCCKLCGLAGPEDSAPAAQRLEDKLTAMEGRLTRMLNARFDDLDERISKRFSDLEDKLRSLKKSVDFG